MVERRTQPFSSTEVTKFTIRPPLSDRQADIFNLAMAYKLSHRGKPMPQVLIAQELDMGRKAVNHHVREIFEKGYALPVVTKKYEPLITSVNTERLNILQERRSIADEVERLRLEEGLTGPQIWTKIRLHHPNISQNAVDGILQWLRERGKIPRVGKKHRSKEEIEAVKADIIKRRKRGIINKRIARQLGISESYLEELNSKMFKSGELERRPQGQRPRANIPMKKLETQ